MIDGVKWKKKTTNSRKYSTIYGNENSRYNVFSNLTLTLKKKWENRRHTQNVTLVLLWFYVLAHIFLIFFLYGTKV